MMQKGLHAVPVRRAHFPGLSGTAGPDADPFDAAEARLCGAIAALGRVAGIDVDRGEGPEDIDASLIQASYECHFADPQCLGGPGCIREARASGTVDVLSSKVAAVTRGMMRYLGRRATADQLREAQACVAAINEALAWTEGSDGH